MNRGLNVPSVKEKLQQTNYHKNAVRQIFTSGSKCLMGSLWTVFWKDSSIVNTRVESQNLNEDSISSGDIRATGSQFQVLGPYAAKLRWPVDVRVQGTKRAPETAQQDWQQPSVDAAGTQRSAR